MECQESFGKHWMRCEDFSDAFTCRYAQPVYKSTEEVGPFETAATQKTPYTRSPGYLSNASISPPPTMLSIRCAKGYASIDLETGKISYTGGCKASDAGRRLYEYTIKAYRDDCGSAK